MDPLSAIFVVAVLGGLFVRGVDVATDGLLSANVGAGVRGAGGFVARDVRDRWRLANEKAREVRSRTRSGRAVQGILDDVGALARTGAMVGRVLFGEAARFGSGVRSGWRTGRDQARSARTARRGSAPWPVTEWLQERAERLRSPRTTNPNETERDPNGEPEREASVTAEEPFPTCLDCGMALVVGTLADHRAGRDRCSFADMPDDPNDPNGDPNVPLDSTVPDQNGDIRCGCCAQRHKPLAPGQHCPACHIHDHTSQTQPAPSGPTKGTATVADITSAPAAIAAWEAFGSRWESLQSRADALHAEQDTLTNDVHALYVDVATLADGMGDFATGRETDTSMSVGELADSATSAREQASNLAGSISTAKEAIDSYIATLHDDFDPSIEAAAGKAAAVHAVMQET